MLLEELAKCGLVGEVQFVGHTLYGHLRCFQQQFRLNDQSPVYPVVGRLSGKVLQYKRQILGCDKKLVGIESHTMVLFGMNKEQTQELLEDFLLAG